MYNIMLSIKTHKEDVNNSSEKINHAFHIKHNENVDYRYPIEKDRLPIKKQKENYINELRMLKEIKKHPNYFCKLNMDIQEINELIHEYTYRIEEIEEKHRKRLQHVFNKNDLF
jgi:hypothetical protein